MTTLNELLKSDAKISANTSKTEKPAVETTEPKTEVLYQSTDNYDRGAPEQFVGTHDTVVPKWQYEGKVVAADDIVSTIEKSFPHEVSKRQLVDPLSGAETPHFGLFYGSQCLPKTVKKSYVPHTRDDCTAAIEACREAFQCDVKVTATWKNGHRICVRPTDNFQREIFGQADAVTPRLVIQGRYDGRSFSSLLGWFRACCNNLTWLKNEGSVERSLRHSCNLRENMGDLIEELTICAQGWEKTVEYLRALEATNLDLRTFLDTVYGKRPQEAGSTQTRHINREESIFARLIGEREKTQRPKLQCTSSEFSALIGTTDVSGWEALNAVQGFSQHAQSRKGADKHDSLLRAFSAADDSKYKKAQTVLHEAVTADGTFSVN